MIEPRRILLSATRRGPPAQTLGDAHVRHSTNNNNNKRSSIAMPRQSLSVLERRRLIYGPGSSDERLARLRELDRATLSSAQQVRRLHELLCFLRAYPDDARVLRQVERMLARFAGRRDLMQQRDALAYSGIAGTLIWFPFFYPTARWLAQRWPDALRLDRTDAVAGESIAKLLPALVSPLEGHALRESHLPGFAALDAMRGRRADATFLIERVAAMPGDEFTREAFYDLINPGCELLPAAGTPSRTQAVFRAAPRSFRTAPLRTQRPDLRREIARAPRRVRRLSGALAREMTDLARVCMVTRERDLDAITYGNPRDVWLVEDDLGLAFALIGMVAERRAALPAIYGGLTLQNGVPIGYHQSDVIGPSVAVSFNTFDTYRGGESAVIFARLLATLHGVFGATSFSIEPYQLGHGNDEGLQSGAWWFYAKLGFRPRARQALALAGSEIARQRRTPGYRSSAGTLQRLAAHHVFFETDPSRPGPFILTTALGLKAGGLLARLADDDRARALALAGQRAQQVCGLGAPAAWSSSERRAWQMLVPLLALLPTRGWTAAERHALVDLVRLKAAIGERDYARKLAGHPRLLGALAALSAAAR
jgi:hypothetical protein